MNYIFLLVLLLSSSLTLQHNEKRNFCKNIRLSKGKPSVYITFERIDKVPPLKSGEKGERVWLRLHNNTCGAISFCVFGVPEIYGEVGIYYEVERVLFQKSGGDGVNTLPAKGSENIEIPIGYIKGDICHMYRLSPGKSTVFSVPCEHLTENLAIKVEFSYEWEELEDVISGREPRHNVYFYAIALPPKK